jgi:rubredoxin
MNCAKCFNRFPDDVPGTTLPFAPGLKEQLDGTFICPVCGATLLFPRYFFPVPVRTAAGWQRQTYDYHFRTH